MAKKRHKYDKKTDTLYVSVDDSEGKVSANFVEAISDFVYFNMNPKSGAIRSMEIHYIKELIGGGKNSDYIEYDASTDCLMVSFKEDGHEQLGADCVWADFSENAMITLDRNEVGNLEGVEIVALDYFLS